MQSKKRKQLFSHWFVSLFILTYFSQFLTISRCSHPNNKRLILSQELFTLMTSIKSFTPKYLSLFGALSTLAIQTQLLGFLKS